MSSPSAKVRPFDLRTDLQRVLRFHLDLIEINFPARGLMDGLEYDQTLRTRVFDEDDSFRKSLEGADTRNNGIFVWEDSGRLVGYAWLALRQEPLFHVPVGVVREIYLVSERRGSGLASNMMSFCLDWFRCHGAKVHRLDVTASNERAVKFYEKFGYKVTRFEMERIDEEWLKQ